MQKMSDDLAQALRAAEDEVGRLRGLLLRYADDAFRAQMLGAAAVDAAADRSDA